jgi:hypothetical protein
MIESRPANDCGERDHMDGAALTRRHLHCLQKIAAATQPRPEQFSSLTMFHLVEMELAKRDDRGNMILTPSGEKALRRNKR